MQLSVQLSFGMEDEVVRRYLADVHEAPITNRITFHLFKANAHASAAHAHWVDKTANATEIAILAALSARHQEQAAAHLADHWRD